MNGFPERARLPYWTESWKKWIGWKKMPRLTHPDLIIALQYLSKFRQRQTPHFFLSRCRTWDNDTLVKCCAGTPESWGCDSTLFHRTTAAWQQELSASAPASLPGRQGDRRHGEADNRRLAFNSFKFISSVVDNSSLWFTNAGRNEALQLASTTI